MNDIRTPFKTPDPITPPATAAKARARQIVIDLPEHGAPTITVHTQAVEMDEDGRIIKEIDRPRWLPAVFEMEPADYAQTAAAVRADVISHMLAMPAAYYDAEAERLDTAIAEAKAVFDAAVEKRGEINATLTKAETALAETDPEEEPERHAHLTSRVESLTKQLTAAQDATFFASDALAAAEAERKQLETNRTTDQFELR